jgi:hypothetical protein
LTAGHYRLEAYATLVIPGGEAAPPAISARRHRG